MRCMLSNHAYLITYVTGVWLVKPKCSFNILKGPEARPEGRSLTTPTTAPSCASGTNKMLTGQRKSTGNPQTIAQKPHILHKHMPACHMHHPTRAYLISRVGWATPPPHNHTHFTPSPPAQQLKHGPSMPSNLHKHTQREQLHTCCGTHPQA